MKQHRVRTAPSIDEQPKDHLFIELKADGWIEVKERPDHKAITRFVRANCTPTRGIILLHTDCFGRQIKNWKEQKPITA